MTQKLVHKTQKHKTSTNTNTKNIDDDPAAPAILGQGISVRGTKTKNSLQHRLVCIKKRGWRKKKKKSGDIAPRRSAVSRTENNWHFGTTVQFYHTPVQ